MFSIKKINKLLLIILLGFSLESVAQNSRFDLNDGAANRTREMGQSQGLHFGISHRAAITAPVLGGQNIQSCRTLKSARNWLRTRWPADHRQESLNNSVNNVLQSAMKRIVQLNNASQTDPKSSFQKLAVYLSEKECLRKDSLVQPPPLRSGLQMDRFLIEDVFCQDDGKGGFIHVHKFACVKPR